ANYPHPKGGTSREENMSISNRSRRTKSSHVEAIAGNGLLNRRALLGRGAVLAGAVSAAPLGALTSAAAEPLTEAPLTEAPRTSGEFQLTPPPRRRNYLLHRRSRNAHAPSEGKEITCLPQRN